MPALFMRSSRACGRPSRGTYLYLTTANASAPLSFTVLGRQNHRREVSSSPGPVDDHAPGVEGQVPLVHSGKATQGVEPRLPTPGESRMPLHRTAETEDFGQPGKRWVYWEGGNHASCLSE